MQPNLPIDLLVCPQTHVPLHEADATLIERLNRAIAGGEVKNAAGRAIQQPLAGGLVRAGDQVLYPIVDEIPILLADEAIGDVPKSSKTIFKRIIDREIPAKIVYEDDLCLAFEDVNPQAPVHILIIPKKEVVSLDDLADDDAALAGHLLVVARKIASERKLSGGWRIVANCGSDAGQSVAHLHFHLLGGRAMAWPPG